MGGVDIHCRVLVNIFHVVGLLDQNDQMLKVKLVGTYLACHLIPNINFVVNIQFVVFKDAVALRVPFLDVSHELPQFLPALSCSLG